MRRGLARAIACTILATAPIVALQWALLGLDALGVQSRTAAVTRTSYIKGA